MTWARYETATGTSTARPVVQIVPEGTAADMALQQAIAGTALVMVVAGYTPPDDATLAVDQRWSTTINPATGVVTHAAVTRRAAVVAALLAARKEALKREALKAFRFDRLLSDTTLSAWVTRLVAIDALASLTAAEPAAVVEADDPDAMRLLDRLYRRGNAVGTVSRMTLGRVTGALLEEGGNSNGSYVRLVGGLLGGLQVAWHAFTTSATGDVTWTYPAAFAGAVSVVGSVRDNSNAPQGFKHVNRSTTSVDVKVVSAGSARVAVGVDVIAVGRWPQA